MVLSGPVYVKVRTNGPFEFIYNNALNSASAGPVLVSQSLAPDLVVTGISAPTAADEGDTIDITWTVRNDGQARAAGSWTDTIFLRKPGLDPNDPATPPADRAGYFHLHHRARSGNRIHAHRALQAAGAH